MTSQVGAVAGMASIVDQIDVRPLDRDGLVATLRDVRRLQASLAALVQRLTSAQAEVDGASDPLSFLLDTGQVPGREARLEARRHRFLEQHPDLAGAPMPAVDAIERRHRRLPTDARERFDAELVRLAELADRLPADTFASEVDRTARNCQADHGDAELSEQIDASRMERWTDADTGMAHTLLVLDPVRDAEVHAAIRFRFRQLKQADESADIRTIDAAVALLTDTRPSGANRAAVGITVDLETLATGVHDETTCEFDSGVAVPPVALERFLCDPIVALLGCDRADQVHKAIQARTASDLQRRALRAMHPTCAHPGCDIGFDACQVHHIVHWQHGGPTELGNLIPLCSTHHHLVHDRGWDYRLGPDRRVTVAPPPPGRREATKRRRRPPSRRTSGRTAPTADMPSTRPRTERPSRPRTPARR